MIDHQWYTSPAILIVIGLGVAMQLLIARALAEGPHVLRTHAGFAGLGLALTLLSHWTPAPDGVNVIEELVIVGWGILFIRIVGIVLFRLVLPMMKVSTPRILHEILFVLASLAWCLVRLRSAGLNLGGIVTTSAAITAILAFSMQETLGNILGGLALQLDKSVNIGDWILIDGVRGKVVEVHWRHTAVLTPNGELVVLPNSILMKAKVTVISSDKYPLARRTVNFSTIDSVAPQEVINEVEKALRAAVIGRVAPQPAPECIVTDFAGGNTLYAVRYWLVDQLHDMSTDSAVRLHIHSALRRNNINFARPNLDLQMDADAEGRNAVQRANTLERRIQILSGVSLFAGMERAELASIASTLKVAPFAKDEVITRQGAVAHWLYVLVLGEADVWFEPPAGERRLLATLTAGAVFGEMGMMTGAPRTATVTARTIAECYRIDKTSFDSILQARPALAEQLAQIMTTRNAQLAVARQQVNQPDPVGDSDNLLARIRRFFKLPAAD